MKNIYIAKEIKMITDTKLFSAKKNWNGNLLYITKDITLDFQNGAEKLLSNLDRKRGKSELSLCEVKLLKGMTLSSFMKSNQLDATDFISVLCHLAKNLKKINKSSCVWYPTKHCEAWFWVKVGREVLHVDVIIGSGYWIIWASESSRKWLRKEPREFSGYSQFLVRRLPG